MENKEYTSREEVLDPSFLELLDQQEYFSSDFAYKVIRPSAENLHLLRVRITASSAGWQRYAKLKEIHSQQPVNPCQLHPAERISACSRKQI